MTDSGIEPEILTLLERLSAIRDLSKQLPGWHILKLDMLAYHSIYVADSKDEREILKPRKFHGIKRENLVTLFL